MPNQRWVTVGVCLALVLLIFGLLIPAIHDARQAARQSTSKNNLKQIGLALHNYHDAHRCFPSGGVIREDDVAMHGWLTMLVPYLSQNNYFNWIDFNNSWENPVNSYVFGLYFHAYFIPGVDDHFTSSGFGLTHHQGNPNIFYRNSSVKLQQMKNGAAHNWFMGEVDGEFQPWGYPFNWRPLGTKICNGSGSYGHPVWRGGHILFADGSVSYFSDETSPEILKSLATAPPVATKEQTRTPSTIFQTGNYQWNPIELESDPQGENDYFANVLQDTNKMPLVIKLYFSANLTEEERDQPKLVIPVSYFFLQIDSTTDIAAALKKTSLFEAASSEQLKANVKTLQALQKRLPEKDSAE